MQVIFQRCYQNSKRLPEVNSKFFCGRKKSEIIQFLLSHSPWYGDVQVIFLRFYWNSKWPPQINFNFLWGAKTKKNCLVNFFLRNMWRCKWFFQDVTEIQNGCQRSTPNFFVEMSKWFFEVLLQFKMAAMDKIHIFLCAQKLKNWSQ